MTRDADDVSAVLWLAAEDYAGLWEVVWQEPYGDVSLISAAERSAVLSTPRFWAEPDVDATSVRISATPTGEAAYQGRYAGTPRSS